MQEPSSSIQRLAPTPSLRKAVESSLSTAIISGEIAPGTLLSGPALAAQFGVSATPVREAMLHLEKLGFVRPVRNKGFRVTHVGRQDLYDLVQIRSWLEAPAMRIVAEKLQGKSMREYQTLATTISEAASRSDLHEFLSVDSRFHLALLELVGNQRLVEVVAELRQQTRLVGLASLRESVELEHSATEHHELLTCLAEGRGADAEALMRTHIGHVTGWWAGLTESPPGPKDPPGPKESELGMVQAAHQLREPV